MEKLTEKYVIDEATRREGGKRNQPRAQVGETTGHVLDIFAERTDEEVIALVRRRRARKRRKG